MMFASEEKLDALIAAIPMEFERVRSEQQAALAQFHEGQRLDGARYVAADTRGGLMSNGRERLVGWSLRAGGSPATVNIRNGRDAINGDIVAVIDLGIAESKTVFLGVGISCPDGVFLELVGGAVAGAVWLGVVD